MCRLLQKHVFPLLNNFHLNHTLDLAVPPNVLHGCFCSFVDRHRFDAEPEQIFHSMPMPMLKNDRIFLNFYSHECHSTLCRFFLFEDLDPYRSYKVLDPEHRRIKNYRDLLTTSTFFYFVFLCAGCAG